MQPSYLPQAYHRQEKMQSSCLPPRRHLPTLGEESDSWIEITSQPSSSSSEEDDEQIITSGLRIATAARQHQRQRRRRRPHPGLADTALIEPESESESECEEEEVVGGKASFVTSNSGFTTSSASTDDEYSGPEDHPEQRTVFSNASSQKREELELELEHDAALRASLSTLLSCAAAARGLPRNRPVVAAAVERGGVSVEGLQVFRGENPPQPLSSRDSTVPDSSLPTSLSVSTSSSGLRRKKMPAKSSGKGSRVKKVKEMTSLRATLMTLAFSAGAIVVLGAIGFSAGYLIGKEMGKTEAGLIIGAAENVRRGRVGKVGA